MLVPAAEERINDASKHPSTSHRMPQRPGKPDEVAFIYLDSASLERVRRTGRKYAPVQLWELKGVTLPSLLDQFFYGTYNGWLWLI
jgi:hypothetical protein